MAGTGIGVDVLGTTRVEVDGAPRPLAAAKPRALLGLLAVRANERVTTDTIVDVLWGEDAPVGAVGTARGYVADLRRVLEPQRARHAAPEVLVTIAGGYCLALDPERVDAGHLEAVVRRASRHMEVLGDDWRPAVADEDRALVATLMESLDRALSQWQGEPLADLGQHPEVEAERGRLRALRLEAEVMRLSALVGLRRHVWAVTDLERLCRAHPWHEHLWALRSVALAGCGRQVEALDSLRRLRRELVEQLGIDPDPRISRLETDLVRQEVSTTVGLGRPAVRCGAVPHDPRGRSYDHRMRRRAH
jgi:DNA-binding SARP family transcriptional activator